MSMAESGLPGAQETPDISGRRRISEIATGLADSAQNSILTFTASLSRIRDSAFAISRKIPHRGTVVFVTAIAIATIVTPMAGDAMGFGAAAEARRAAEDEDYKFYEMYRRALDNAFNPNFGPAMIGNPGQINFPTAASFVSAAAKDKTLQPKTIGIEFPFTSQGLEPPLSPPIMRTKLFVDDGTLQRAHIDGNVTPIFGQRRSVKEMTASLRHMLRGFEDYDLQSTGYGKAKDPIPALKAIRLDELTGQPTTIVFLTELGYFQYQHSYNLGTGN